MATTTPIPYLGDTYQPSSYYYGHMFHFTDTHKIEAGSRPSARRAAGRKDLSGCGPANNPEQHAPTQRSPQPSSRLAPGTLRRWQRGDRVPPERARYTLETARATFYDPPVVLN